MQYFKCNVKIKNESITLKEWMESFYLAKNKINYLIDNKKVMVNDQIVKKRDYLLHNNDLIVINTSNYESIDYLPMRHNLEILYEDDYILVVNKPSGYIIYPENKDLSNTVANMIADYYLKTNQQRTIRHVHRLDSDTSGCLVYAKDIFTHSFLSHSFENSEIKKEYFAVVCGIIENDGRIDSKIGRNRHNNLMIVSNTGKPALTEYHVIKNINGKTLLKVNIKTGRTHQIRVHLASIGHPIVGDYLYGAKIVAHRVMLHCNHIGFIHPITNSWIDFYSDLPLEMKKILEED